MAIDGALIAGLRAQVGVEHVEVLGEISAELIKRGESEPFYEKLALDIMGLRKIKG